MKIINCCPACGGHLEFDSAHGLIEVPCPHCAAPVVLTYPPPRPATRSRALVITLWSLLIGALFGVVIGLIVWIDDRTIIRGFIMFAFVMVVYFTPSLVGLKKRNAAAIFVLNFFLGWTFIGWVAALVWACMKDSERRS